MSQLDAALRRVAADLHDLGRRWALVGGLAVSARAEPRMTRDIDLAVAVANDAEAEALAFDLRSRGYRVLMALEQTAVSRLSTLRLATPGSGPEGVVIDLLVASSGIEAEVVDAAEVLEILPGLHVPVARTAHLLALKVLARDDRERPQDADDIRALLRESAPADVEEARRALTLIQKRGYHRGRRLVQQFGRMIRTRSK